MEYLEKMEYWPYMDTFRSIFYVFFRYCDGTWYTVHTLTKIVHILVWNGRLKLKFIADFRFV